MSLKLLKPIINSQRNLILLNKKKLNKKPFLKHKIIQFFRSNITSAIVTSIEYDSNRTANIASIFDFLNNKYFYIVAPKSLKPGDIIKSGVIAEKKLGHSLPIFKIPVGSFLNNISPKKKTISQISRSAGSFSTLLKKTVKYAIIKISSGEQRKISLNCFAVIGLVSNQFYFLTTVSKAGRSYWLKTRPKVRGVAKNPVDHFNGGGEGKKSGKSLFIWKKLSSNSKNKLILKYNAI